MIAGTPVGLTVARISTLIPVCIAARSADTAIDVQWSQGIHRLRLHPDPAAASSIPAVSSVTGLTGVTSVDVNGTARAAYAALPARGLGIQRRGVLSDRDPDLATPPSRTGIVETIQTVFGVVACQGRHRARAARGAGNAAEPAVRGHHEGRRIAGKIATGEEPSRGPDVNRSGDAPRPPPEHRRHPAGRVRTGTRRSRSMSSPEARGTHRRRRDRPTHRVHRVHR